MSGAPAPLAGQFAAAMAGFEPLGRPVRLAIAVSGGADSTALALLVGDWARGRTATIIALIVNHGLRPGSAGEAALTAQRLAQCGIASRIITLAVAPGAALQHRARDARYAALATAAADASCVHLLLGHHARDQEEVRIMRAARGTRGSAGMAPFTARRDIVLLRPLLDGAPEALRHFLMDRAVDWVEDPSNADPRFERARLRTVSLRTVPQHPTPDPGSDPASGLSLEWLARHASIDNAGFAWLAADTAPIDALAALFRVIGGAVYPPARASVASLAARLRPATLGGVRIMKARGGGWTMLREFAACAGPIAAEPGRVWDGRFRLALVPVQADAIAALGHHAAAVRRRHHPPAAILRTLPAAFRHGEVLAVPHLGIGPLCRLYFDPPAPVTATLEARSITVAPDAVLACVRRGRTG